MLAIIALVMPHEFMLAVTMVMVPTVICMLVSTMIMMVIVTIMAIVAIVVITVVVAIVGIAQVIVILITVLRLVVALMSMQCIVVEVAQLLKQPWLGVMLVVISLAFTMNEILIQLGCFKPSLIA
jgi:hypothetical protein